MSEIILSLSGLTKSFGNTKVLDGISVDIKQGEFVTLLGPSGCGKTTTLRLIAGLETPDEGRISIRGQDVTKLPSEKRTVNTVFQNYALFPHMNVFNNIAYGLKIKNTPKQEIQQKVTHMLEEVQMSGYENRMPNQLSGGQRQRIAIARALINQPDVLLLDEPLGALDLKLRQHMQIELKAIQETLGITFVYVTHDQDEALNMSNRLVIMNEGRICQIGTPKEVYDLPQNRFVAEFVGDRNIIEGDMAHKDGNILSIEFAGTEIPAKNLNGVEFQHRGGGITAAIHSDRVRLSQEPPEGFFLEGTIASSNYTGAITRTDVALANGGHIKKTEYNSHNAYEKGEKVFISWDAEDCLVVESGALL